MKDGFFIMANINIPEDKTMKPLTRILATVVLVLAGSLAVLAQDNATIHSIKIADLHDDPAIINLNVEFRSGGSWIYLEDMQSLEAWMTESESWMNEPIGISIYALLDTDTESELVLEDWMLGVPVIQEVKINWNFLKVEPEDPVKLEDWMICREPWCPKKRK